MKHVSLLCLALAAAPALADEAITKEWPQLGGDGARNNTPVGVGVATEWEVGDFDFRTGAWDSSSAVNIKWAAKLGSQAYGNCVVAGGKAFIGTNNEGGWIERYPAEVDLGCLLAFDIETGEFVWQHSSEKLASGNENDWALQGICCASLVEGDRLWFVTSRGEVRCLDTEGFRDGENDGPVTNEHEKAKEQLAKLNAANLKIAQEKAAAEGEPIDFAEITYEPSHEADVVWVFDMMAELGIWQHNMCSCSVTAVGDILLVNTGNGVNETHLEIPAPDAPSFLALDKNTGKVLWTDKSPGANLLHGQWSSPMVMEAAMPDGSTQSQVVYGGGDGWVYSFDPVGDGRGGSKLLWKFDANPKDSEWVVGGRGTRNNIVSTPVAYKNRVYVAVGQDPEHGDGAGHLWCIDPTGSGDVSPELVFNAADPDTPIAPKRVQAAVADDGDLIRPNPNSKAIWHYSELDANDDGEVDPYMETMHRSLGAVAIRDDILYIADLSGIFHCLNAMAEGTPEVYWTYDMYAAAWGSPLIVEDKVYIGDEDGEVAVFKHSADPAVAMVDDGGEPAPAYGAMNMDSSVYSTPIVADNVLYISSRTHLFAIEAEKE